MPIKESVSEQEGLILSRCTGESVTWNGLKTVNLETANESFEEKWSNKQLRFDDVKFVGKVNLKTKCTKKSFRKWAMSKGCSRDEAERINKLVAAQKGRVSYETLYLSVIFGVYFGK